MTSWKKILALLVQCRIVKVMTDPSGESRLWFCELQKNLTIPTKCGRNELWGNQWGKIISVSSSPKLSTSQSKNRNLSSWNMKESNPDKYKPGYATDKSYGRNFLGCWSNREAKELGLSQLLPQRSKAVQKKKKKAAKLFLQWMGTGMLMIYVGWPRERVSSAHPGYAGAYGSWHGVPCQCQPKSVSNCSYWSLLSAVQQAQGRPPN